MHHHRRTRIAAVGTAVVLAASLSACRVTGWGDAAARPVAASATAWIKTQQQADGGFEVAGFPGFETPDAVMAIAEDAQQQLEWNPTQARTAVEATKSTTGKSPLDWADDYADGAIGAGPAAKLVVLVALPLGLSPTAFDPQGDGAKDLLATIAAGRQPSGSYGSFGTTLYAAMAVRAAGGTVDPTTVAFIRDAQEAGGGWDFQGDASGADADVDTTSAAILALLAAGVADTDVDLRAGLAYLATTQAPSGAWTSFGSDDPNSTSMAVLAVTGAGYDPNLACWRDRVAPALAGSAYSSPTAWIRAQQQPDGHIASPSDGWGLNTFATAQSVQALRRAWMPVNAVPRVTCP